MRFGRSRMRTLSTLCGIWLISVGFVGFTAAQQPFVPPTGEMLLAGAPGASPGDLSKDVESPLSDGISAKTVFDVLSNVQADERSSRGPRDIALFKALSPSVVLISTTKEMGSGSVISDGLILTSAHVVGDASVVGVLYKPDAVSNPVDTSMITARVVKLDKVRDLALLRPSLISSVAKPIDLGDIKDIQIGADVHAIGHPKGQEWSYTTGIISQIRNDYSWLGYRANVIQTQTPINPGNSGGPLLTDDGKLIGVNAFLIPGSQGLNFAVSVTDVRSFLAAPNIVAAFPEVPPKQVKTVKECSPKTLFEGRNKDNNANIRTISLKCDEFPDLVFLLPDDKASPMMALMDSKRRNKSDVYIFDYTRKGKWQISYWDVDFDDTFALKGIHNNGEIEPVRYEKRCPGKAGKNFSCL
jgi:S1-C subfamily serine protease